MKEQTFKATSAKVVLPTHEQFNEIADVRVYLLNHPDKEMIIEACLHYLGNDAQMWYRNRGKEVVLPTEPEREAFERLDKIWGDDEDGKYNELYASHCPTCGAKVKIHQSDEGTGCFEVVEEDNWKKLRREYAKHTNRGILSDNEYKLLEFIQENYLITKKL